VIFLEWVYVASVMLLATLGFNALVLCALYIFHRNKDNESGVELTGDNSPTVLVQLPVFNERHVVERLVKAISRLDYPRDRLIVQLLDDSTDETVNQAVAAVAELRAHGFPIRYVRRDSREGYKAGALSYGMGLCDAEYIAIFDADFEPEPDFLRKVIPHFLADEQLGLVQTRWAHLNAKHSLLTRAQALALDAHFVVEQTARNRSGLLMNFAGTAGIWRRACIEESGGWQGDTLSEDIDLSYRAQLDSWRCLYLPEVGAPAEVPPLMMAFKRQQARWATGTVQCLLKLGGRVFQSHLTLLQKIEAFLHLGGYFVHPLMLIVLLLSLPLLWLDRLNGLHLAGLGIAMLGMPLQILIAQQRLYDNWFERFLALPILMIIGVGIGVSNTEAVLKGLSGRRVAFARTPKFQVCDQQEGSYDSRYMLPIDHTTWIEMVFCLYAIAALIVAIERQSGAAIFMGLYVLGFSSVSLASLREHLSMRAPRTLRKGAWSFSNSRSD
jgi:cellulose synthase/poly-beta-1,6-N-acetylglucosamine synthase-like glycosyltransferase